MELRRPLRELGETVIDVTDPGLDEAAIGWARGACDAMRPFANGGVYVNFSGLGDTADDLHAEIFGSSQRLFEEIRSECDPQGLFTAAAFRP